MKQMKYYHLGDDSIPDSIDKYGIVMQEVGAFAWVVVFSRHYLLPIKHLEEARELEDSLDAPSDKSCKFKDYLKRKKNVVFVQDGK